MRSQTRLVTAAVVFTFLVLSFLRLKGHQIPDYLPQEAHDYFHPGERPLQTPGQPPAQQPAPKPDSTSNVAPTVIAATPTQSLPFAEASSSDPPKTELDHLLQKFLGLPILSYPESVAANSKLCPTDGINYDRNAIEGNVDNWPNIDSTQIAQWRHSIVAHMRLKQKEEQEKAPSGDVKGGRGIVMAAGDFQATIRARTNIRFLESYNSTLPVEIFHFADELSKTDQKLLEDLSRLEQNNKTGMKVTLRLVEGVQKGQGWKQFQIKGAAIQQSSFNEILYLDTDSYLLRNPDYIFESKQWNDTGLLLWPDYTKSHPTNPLWRLLGQPCRNEFEGESGQIFISRTLHQDLMWLVEYFALYHEEYYGFMGGDRDSFRAAALLLGKKWAGPGRINAAAGIGNVEDASGGGHTMLQADPEGKWMFVHANLVKHAHFGKPLWSRIQRVAQDKFAPGTTYGNIDPPNDKVGDGVKLHVSSTPRMSTTMTAFEGYEESVFVIEDWNMYEELRDFEQKWFGFGGVH
ncbi:hypothetical protein BP6252_07594 [Coleophoma cylindrospora]|uniref:Glycosyltransferase family 71 protein n=1 Tax=Coleophoma cylindrospora TaxID=1849047 RepID=A0A3D8RAX1_9HELO|nr:hypothetical protein BP6252_07594 [Coleophoma cylindrospora]